MIYEIVPLIRDIAIIVMAVLVTALSITLLIMLRKVYPPLRRGVSNFEMASQLMLDVASRVATIVSVGSNLAGLFRDIVQRLRNRGVTEEGPPESEDIQPP